MTDLTVNNCICVQVPRANRFWAAAGTGVVDDATPRTSLFSSRTKEAQRPAGNCLCARQTRRILLEFYCSHQWEFFFVAVTSCKPRALCLSITVFLIRGSLCSCCSFIISTALHKNRTARTFLYRSVRYSEYTQPSTA